MSTSDSTDYSTTRDTIIKYAMLEIGALGSGESPTTNETTDCAEILNAMVKHWQIFHNLHRVKEVSVTLTPGTPSYTIGDGQTIDEPRPLKIIAARRQDSAGIEIPIEIFSRNEYMDTPQKSTQAPANGIYYDRQRTTGTVYVWPTGSSGNTTVILTVARALEDLDSEDDEPDYPQEWVLALYKNLAVQIAPMFRRSAPDLTIFTAANLLAELKGQETEPVSIMVRPNARN